jgi:hypothetical protein
MTSTMLRDERRGSLIAWLMAAPAVLMALTMCAIEGWRVLQPESRLFATPFVYSLADAIEQNDVQRAYEFVRDGHDPEQLIAVQHALLAGGRPALVAPLEWAAATGSRETLLMLLGFSARVDQRIADRALCAAHASGNGQIAELLIRYGSAAPTATCPPPPQTAESADAAAPRPASPPAPARPAPPSPTR